jgi:hypothetical protein
MAACPANGHVHLPDLPSVLPATTLPAGRQASPGPSPFPVLQKTKRARAVGAAAHARVHADAALSEPFLSFFLSFSLAVSQSVSLPRLARDEVKV